MDIICLPSNINATVYLDDDMCSKRSSDEIDDDGYLSSNETRESDKFDNISIWYMTLNIK